MNNNLYLFDVDGTIAESGEQITDKMKDILLKIGSYNEIGIVGGGKLDKILWQLRDVKFKHYFTECGCIYNKYYNNSDTYIEIYKKNIREHPLYNEINKLIKIALQFLSNVEYTLTGNFIDLRSGLIYISLIGMSANESERKRFITLDNSNNYRKRLLDLLFKEALKLNIWNKIHIVYGGSVGIAIYPSEYDKKQIMEHININNYNEIHYFGDKYENNGNDFNLLNHSKVIGHKINKVEDTYNYLYKLNGHNFS